MNVLTKKVTKNTCTGELIIQVILQTGDSWTTSVTAHVRWTAREVCDM